MAVRPEGANHQ